MSGRLTRSLTVVLLASGTAAAPALGADRCVGQRAGCTASLQDALDAARDGDSIRLTAGTFPGGVTVTKSVALIGAGRRATIIRGGGPVLTIGTLDDDTPPTVSIRDLTLTGARTTSSDLSVAEHGVEGVLALGGGIHIPPGRGSAPGATVAIRHTTITRNRVAPVATVPSGNATCPDGRPCPFARAAGGGIDTWGALTVSDSTISDNRVGSASGISTLTSDAEAAGIYSHRGALSILRSRIEDNRATATGPYARFADGGGIFVLDAPFNMRDSRVSGNHAKLTADLPSSVEQSAIAGGIHIAASVPTAEITNSVIAGNEVGITNSAGDAIALSGGLHVDLPVDFTISDSAVSGNSVSAAALGAEPGFAHADGGGGQLFGRMDRTRVAGNTVIAGSSGGEAEAMAGGSWVLFGDVRDSELDGNRIHATARHGEARVRGGGAVIDAAPELPDQGGLSLIRSGVDANTATADGSSSIAQGGGLFDAALDEPFGGPLSLAGSSVTQNVLRGTKGATLQGGGVYLDGQPLTQTDSRIVANVPDQCFGCGPAARATIARLPSISVGHARAGRAR
jgi:hypothetical protein